MGGPELELGVAGCAELYEVFVAPVVQFDARDRLRVAAVERFGQPEDRGERTHRLPFFRAERAEVAVRLLRRGFAVIAGDEGNRFGFCRLETAQIAVLDEVVPVLVMTRIADVRADVVQQRRKLEPLTLAIGQHMSAARLIEDRQRQPRHLVGMLGPVAAPLCQLDDASAPHVRVFTGLRDVAPVALDVVENEPFAQRQIAQRNISRPKPLQHSVEQHGARHNEVGAPGIESRHLHPFADAAFGELFPKAMNLLRRDAQVADLVARAPAIGGRNRAEAQNRPGCADHAVESGALDVAQVFRELAVDMPNELALVTSRQRVCADEPFGEPDDAEFEAFGDT